MTFIDFMTQGNTWAVVLPVGATVIAYIFAEYLR